MSETKYLSLIIKNSPYSYIPLEIDSKCTIAQLKNLVIEKYNSQQTCSDQPIYFTTLSGSIFDFSKVKENKLPDNLNVFDWMTEKKYDYESFYVYNTNIEHRMQKTYAQYLERCVIPSKPKIYYAKFNYSEFDLTKQQELGKICFPVRSAVNTFAFYHIGTFTDKSHLIRFIKPQMLNFGSGPELSQFYYRLFSDGTAGVYYGEGIGYDKSKHEKEYKMKFESIEAYLMADIYEVHMPTNKIHWNVEPDSCDICAENNPQMICAPCLHVRVCALCPYNKLTKCTQCNQEIKGILKIEHFK